MIDKFGKAILTMFGVGYFKYAPGTAASFLTCIIFYLLYTSSFYIGQGPAVIVCILLIILVYSIIIIDKLSYLFKKKDSEEIVIDEFIGQSIPLTVYFFFRTFSIEEVFFFFGWPFLGWTIISFILFRFFDIVKPFPINIVDKKMKNGLGVMLDDIIAGAYSAITIYIFYALWF
tara:strand:+ start:122 stop:643 length:522 start_codon:yes stop_codon:yes gene_type:complete